MRRLNVWLVALGIGVVNALLLRVFELAVNDGTNELWNRLFRSDSHRWVVVPLAVGLSLLYSLIIRSLGQQRVIKPETDLLAEMSDAPSKLSAIGVILLIGLVSLLAGASLGPEASLLAASAAIGGWAAAKAKTDLQRQLLILASVGALLVAFLGSFMMVLVPLLLLLQQKKFKPLPAALMFVAAGAAYGTIWLVDRAHPGFGTAPPLPALSAHDFIVAPFVGAVAAFVAAGLNQAISRLTPHIERLDQHIAWPLAAAAFGLALGGLYLLGGQSIEFSGNVGSKQLISDHAQSGAAVLIGLLTAKLLATAWSKITGYRGGLVFPSIYLGVALGLLVGSLAGSWGGAGAMIGGIAGTLSAVTGSSVVAAVFVLAVLPVALLPVALVAIAGAAGGNWLLGQLAHRHA